MNELLKFPDIYDANTGEVLEINKLTSKNIERFLATQPDPKLSNLLSRLNFVRKIAEKVEKAAKNYIKKNKNVEFDASGEAFFEEWRIKKIVSNRFSEKACLESGNARDIADWKRLKERYTVPSETVKFG